MQKKCFIIQKARHSIGTAGFVRLNILCLCQQLYYN